MTRRFAPVCAAIGLAASALVASGCATLQQIAALRQVEFAIDGVGGGRLAGIELNRIRSVDDLSAADAARLAAALAEDDVPFAFTVDVRAENPAENRTTARMVRFAWTLLLDDRETVEGVVDREISLPPGEPRIVPVEVQLNLVEFYDGSGRDLLELALRAAGVRSGSPSVKLRASPTIETPLGPMDYPATITIVPDS